MPPLNVSPLIVMLLNTLWFIWYNAQIINQIQIRADYTKRFLFHRKSILLQQSKHRVKWKTVVSRYE